MSRSNTFQDVILTFLDFWADYGCIIWQPYNIQVGAGTMNPATALRVLGPEPWYVAYIEPSIRPDDGRFGDNPNRMQQHYQLQVILKPDPGNPQEIYLQSLEAIGINRRQHDIRFVEDNWESPALGAWGLGWEVWLDGQEITQFTYFQQAGGQNLTPNSVEITYGLERIVLALQGVNSVWEMQWSDSLTYGDVLLQAEIEHCMYAFNTANIPALKETFNTYEEENSRALSHEPPLVVPAYDYVLKCSHLFNVLDTRGAIGVVERADYFKRMQTMAAKVARAYVDQRFQLELPMLPADWEVDPETRAISVPVEAPPKVKSGSYPKRPAPFLLEIGTEELPAADLDEALAQLKELVPQMLDGARLNYSTVQIAGTPRRLIVYVTDVTASQRADERIERGPPTTVAYKDGKPTKAAEGFARKFGLTPDDLIVQEIDGGEYVAVQIKEEGRPTHEVLAELLPGLIASLRFGKSMRWNWSGVAFSRPIRWIVALHDKGVIPFEYAGVHANRITRGTRPNSSPLFTLDDTAEYFTVIEGQGIIIDREARRTSIAAQVSALAEKAGGILMEDPGLLAEVTNLVEQPTALLGRFDEADLALPDVVLITVMKKHQRYFAVVDKKGNLLPVFIAVRNGDAEHLETVIDGNEHVIRARFADARFFYNEDIKQSLGDYITALKLLTFQEALGSYYDKAARLEGIAARLGNLLGLSDDTLDQAIRAARLCKADLITSLVVEMTSLQGIMGEIYAQRSGESKAVAAAIREHYLPRFAGDVLPQSEIGITLALADRLDSLVGLLAVGLAPTGSTDPYGLRRAALGLVQILLSHKIDLDLSHVVEWVAKKQSVAVSAAEQKAVLEFIAGRLHGILREEYAHDVVEAVLGAQSHNPTRAAIHAAQLTGWIARKDWEQTLDAYARCARITRNQEAVYPINPDGYTEVVEKELYAGYVQTLEALGDQPDVETFLTAFDPLVPAIGAFFAPADEGGVLVMDKDQAVRENRLGLLQAIVALAAGVADFSKLEGF